MTKEDLTPFLKYVSKYPNIEYAECENLGEVNNYKRAMLKAKDEGSDFTVVLEQDYFYEEDVFLSLKRILLDWNNGPLPCVLSPFPKFTCEMFSPSHEELRTVKGVHLVGTFINVHDYFESEGFLDIYYETRNRYYLWDEYQKLDPAYVALDKKLAKKEIQEIRNKDKNYREKLIFYDRGRLDYKKGILGPIEL